MCSIYNISDVATLLLSVWIGIYGEKLSASSWTGPVYGWKGEGRA